MKKEGVEIKERWRDDFGLVRIKVGVRSVVGSVFAVLDGWYGGLDGEVLVWG